jgi:tetratricopeptide (TPR) repeat protein
MADFGISAAATVVAKAVLTELAKPSARAAAERVRAALGKASADVALKEASAAALARFAKAHPEAAKSFFDEHFLRTRAAPLLVRMLEPTTPPTAVELTAAWNQQFFRGSGQPSPKIEAAAADFLDAFGRSLREHRHLQDVFNARAFDAISSAVSATAELAAKTEEHLAAIRGVLSTPDSQAPAAGQLTRAARPDPEDLARRVRDLDWRQLGVRPARRGAAEGWSVKVQRAVDRKIETGLRRAVTTPVDHDALRFLVVIGRPGVGKTRALFDAAQLVCPGAFAHVPPDPASLAAALDSRVWVTWEREMQTPLLIWLDDIERFIAPDETGLTPPRLHTLRAASRPIVIVATLGAKAPRRASDDDNALTEAQSHEHVSLLDDVLAQCTAQIAVPVRGVQSSVLAESVEVGRYSNDDADEIREHGIGPFSLGLDRLERKLEGGQGQSRAALAGRAVAVASLTWTAAGVPTPLDEARLRQLARFYFPGRLTPDAFDAGLDWSLEPVIGDLALVSRRDDGYVGTTLLSHTIRASADARDWSAVLRIATGTEAGWIAQAARGHPELTRALLEFADDNESLTGVEWFGFHVAMGYVWRAVGARDRAAESWAVGMEHGCACSAFAIADERLRDDDVAGAGLALERALEAGHYTVCLPLADCYMRLHQPAFAAEVLALGANNGDAECAYGLGSIYRDQLLLPAAAMDAFRRALSLRYVEAWMPLATLCERRGDFVGMAQACDAGSRLGDGLAAAILGQIRAEELGDVAGAISAYERALELGETHVMFRLATLYRDRDDADDRRKAQELYAAGRDRGSGRCAHFLAHLQAADEAVETGLREALELGDATAAVCLATLLDDRGDRDGARTALRTGAEMGHADAAARLADELEAISDVDGARWAWERLLDLDDGQVAVDVGRKLLARGEVELAEELLLHADELGVPAAAHELADLWTQQGRTELGEEAKRRADMLHSAI